MFGQVAEEEWDAAMERDTDRGRDRDRDRDCEPTDNMYHDHRQGPVTHGPSAP